VLSFATVCGLVYAEGVIGRVIEGYETVMVRRALMVLLPLLVLLTGCFQPAGTSLQEQSLNITEGAPFIAPTTAVEGTGGSALPEGPTAIPSTATPNIPTPNAQGISGSPTATLPIAMTIISPTRSVPPTAIPGAVDNSAGTPLPTLDPSTVITPAIPLGPVTSVPAQPTQPLQPPTTTPSGLITPTAFSAADLNGNPNCLYTVQGGDTLFRIALSNEVSLESLRAANPDLSGDIIQPGQELVIPDCVAEDDAETSDDVAAAEPTTVPTSAGPTPTSLPGGSQTYVVQAGDTLYTIGLRFGVNAEAIQAANNMDDPNRLAIGQELVIPAAP
jgi:LysM repeat protein